MHYFRMMADGIGPSAVAYDSRHRSINLINGFWKNGDTIESVRRAALKHWPGVKDRTS